MAVKGKKENLQQIFLFIFKIIFNYGEEKLVFQHFLKIYFCSYNFAIYSIFFCYYFNQGLIFFIFPVFNSFINITDFPHIATEMHMKNTIKFFGHRANITRKNAHRLLLPLLLISIRKGEESSGTNLGKIH